MSWWNLTLALFALINCLFEARSILNGDASFMRWQLQRLLCKNTSGLLWRHNSSCRQMPSLSPNHPALHIYHLTRHCQESCDFGILIRQSIKKTVSKGHSECSFSVIFTNSIRFLALSSHFRHNIFFSPLLKKTEQIPNADSRFIKQRTFFKKTCVHSQLVLKSRRTLQKTNKHAAGRTTFWSSNGIKCKPETCTNWILMRTEWDKTSHFWWKTVIFWPLSGCIWAIFLPFLAHFFRL